MRALNVERALLRTGIGCGVAAAVVVGSIAVGLGVAVLGSLVSPSRASSPGFGQGVGILILPFFAAAPIAGTIAAWRTRVGVVVGAVLVLAYLGLCAAALAGV